MASQNELRLAKEVYETLCSALDNRNWRYSRNDEKLIIDVSVSGDDLPMDFMIKCDADYQIIRLQSFLPFKMSEEKRVEGSIVTNYINYRLVDGSFDYNIGDGTILFRLTSSFRDSLVQEEVFDYMIDVSCGTIDAYNDKLLMLSKGLMSISDVIQE
ncbi:MAG: YbjN domain-containing protein [Clostridia bacterium]|nr:YbjN domain-containing protein [Clostridia bacterium]